jgi:hypothetical protein
MHCISHCSRDLCGFLRGGCSKLGAASGSAGAVPPLELIRNATACVYSFPCGYRVTSMVVNASPVPFLQTWLAAHAPRCCAAHRQAQRWPRAAPSRHAIGIRCLKCGRLHGERGRRPPPGQSAAGRHLLGDLAVRVRALGAQQKPFCRGSSGTGQGAEARGCTHVAPPTISWRPCAFACARGPTCNGNRPPPPRLLGKGKSVTDVWPLMASSRTSSDAGSFDQLLSEEERLAQRGWWPWSCNRAARRYKEGACVHPGSKSLQGCCADAYLHSPSHPNAAGAQKPTHVDSCMPRPLLGCQQLLGLLGVKTSIDDIRVSTWHEDRLMQRRTPPALSMGAHGATIGAHRPRLCPLYPFRAAAKQGVRPF